MEELLYRDERPAPAGRSFFSRIWDGVNDFLYRLSYPHDCPDCRLPMQDMTAVASALEHALGVPEDQVVCAKCGYQREARRFNSLGEID